MPIKLSAQEILQQIAQIQHMERGKLSVMRQGPAGPFYKLQVWENDKNVSRYVPREQASAVQEAIEGHQRFQKLTELYAQHVIQKTREEIASASKKKKLRRSTSSLRTPRSSS